jgi:hypothetical protein
MRRLVGAVVVGLVAMSSGMVASSVPRVGAADAATFRGLTPARLLDTRSPYVTVDGQFGGLGRVVAGGSIDLVVADRGGVPPSGAGSVARNVTSPNRSAADT